jgi:hypothetical protein
MVRIVSAVILTLYIGSLIQPDEKVPAPGVHTYPEQLPGTFTGGFGEQTCQSCHFDYPLNPVEEGSLAISGIPDSYKSGSSYAIVIEVNRQNLGKAGFQLSARTTAGTQAGSFSLDQERLRFTNESGDIQYVQHTAEGTRPTGQHSTVWQVKWTAPSKAAGPVTFNVATNAANGDDSEFGDLIFASELISQPSASE